VHTKRRGYSTKQLVKENEGLRAQLAVSGEILRAIRGGEVDAFLTDEAGGSRVLTLEGGESAYRALVEAMNEGAAIVNDAGILVYCNSRLATMLNSPLESVIGASLFVFCAAPEKASLEMLLERGKTETYTSEMTFCRRDGVPGPVHLSLSPMKIHGMAAIGIVVTDLTERNRMEELRNLSMVDELTGLLNRRGFISLAAPNLKVAHRLKGPVLLMFIDLDGLKAINDDLGHVEGDRALTDTALILRNTFRDTDIIARLGGDEFTVLAMGTPETNSTILATRLQRQLDAHNARVNRPFRLSMSVGIVCYDPEVGLTIDDMIARADGAMYVNKRSKKMGLPASASGPLIAASHSQRLR
jgi:diguanylate cyclase (GGDEF)-like protein/PAS domain S-box-containing protein